MKKTCSLVLAALLPLSSPAGIIVDTTGVEIEGRFTFTKEQGLMFHVAGAEATSIKPGNFRTLEFSTSDAIWPEEFRNSAKAELGLLGTYFEGTKLEGNKRERVDSDIAFNWHGGGPFEDWRTEQFSVRWTGTLEVTRTGDYEFITTSDDGVRLTINDVELIKNWSDHSLTENRAKIHLEKDRDHSIRIDYYENSGEALMKVEYIDPSQARRSLNELILSPPDTVARKLDLPKLSTIGLKPGLVLRDGTFLSAQIKQANDTAFVLGKPFDDLTISTFNIARVVFREIPTDTAARATADRQGALLVGGDFVDGEFKSFERGMLKLSSLLFGFQSLETKYETHALLLREPKFDQSNWRVRDYRGNALLAEKLEFDGDDVVITSPVLKEFRLPLSRVYRIDSGTGKELFPLSLGLGPNSVHAQVKSRRSEDDRRSQSNSLRKLAAREKDRRMRGEADLKKRITAELDDAATAREESEELEQKVSGLREDFTKAEKEYSAAAAKYDEVYAQYNQTIAEQKTSSKASDQAKGVEGRANSNMKNLDRYLDSLRGKLKSNNRNRSEAQMQRLKANAATTEKKYTAAKEAYAQAKKKSAEAAERKSSLIKLAAKLRGEVGRSKSDRDNKRRTMDRRKKSLLQYEAKLKSARNKLATAAAKVDARKKTELR